MIDNTFKNDNPSIEEIEQHCDKFHLDKECPDCSNDHWELAGTPPKECIPFFLVPYPRSRPYEWRYHACFILICTQCGYVKYYSKSKVKSSAKDAEETNK